MNIGVGDRLKLKNAAAGVVLHMLGFRVRVRWMKRWTDVQFWRVVLTSFLMSRQLDLCLDTCVCVRVCEGLYL